MSFYHVSVLPKNILEQCKRDNVSSFECDIDTIKGYLTEIANTYLSKSVYFHDPKYDKEDDTI